jgi:eukaryotic-like serine/threonine-protein kinase
VTDESIFAAALAIPEPSQRAVYLDRACADPAARCILGHSANSPSLPGSPDGRCLVSTHAETKDPDDRIVWLDAATGEEVRAVKVPKGQLGSECRIVFRRDGRWLATHPQNASGQILVWEVEPMLRGEASRPALTITGHPGNIRRVEFNPDGRRLLTCGGGVVKLWAIASGREVLTLKAPGDVFFSPDSFTIWGGLDENARLWGWDGTPVREEKTP